MPERTFLGGELAPDACLCALAANSRDWIIERARASGRTIRRERGLVWATTTGGPGDAEVAFSQYSSTHAGPQIDAILDTYRSQAAPRGVLCWWLAPDPPAALGVRLAARGFTWGFRPHWMWLDLQTLRTDHPQPPGLTITIDDDSGPWNVQDLSYYDPAMAPIWRRLARQRSRRFWHFIARLDGRVVGHSGLWLTTGGQGIAGLYDVGVVPDARRQGIGTAVTRAACQHARDLGCRYAGLNATPDGERVYRRLGFVSLGHGQTWFLHPEILAAPKPSPTQVAFAEAIGFGDVPALDVLAPCLPPDAAEQPLANGLRPLDLAVHTAQPAAATWLVAHGATLDVLSAWDLGWRDRVPSLLAHAPSLANRRSGPFQATPLHEAARRGDLALARLLLAADPDLDLQDATFHSTPLGWARHFGHTEIAALIEQHRATAPKQGEE